MFQAFENKGFQVSFPNGLTLSVHFGPGNYCEHRSERTRKVGSKDAEIAVFETTKPISGWGYRFADGEGGSGSCGWLSPVMVARTMALVAEHSGPYEELSIKLRELLK